MNNLNAPEWYWKLAIAGGAFVALAVVGWLLWRLGKKLYVSYRATEEGIESMLLPYRACPNT
ncbi:hypothetical protein E2F48_11460 [Arthrobacter crusticola]|uniref:Uncharacterized protein n=1 Tax=Arthrobacter crusticola TaxID=2547960 RepID=A0A4R5TXB8_9MICC|nr:hypothetical protein [Arthrobacter crusticola]TDK25834.1 hypothetical protein E2F48_11460 [Arthrobacter crusticola]